MAIRFIGRYWYRPSANLYYRGDGMRGQVKTRHQRKAEEKKAAKKEARAKRVREWSANRPKPAEQDEVIGTTVQELTKLVQGGTAWEQADKTGLCTSTIYRFRNGKVYEPRFRTLQMIAAARGGRMVFVKDKKDG